MKDNVSRTLQRAGRSFSDFTTGQKVVAVLGTAALLLAGFLVFRWATQPSYAPLFSNLAGTDASAVIEELDTRGIPYELSGGGNTIMVPSDQVYTTRIALSGDGLPSASEGGYSLLDEQDLSTSEFQEQTDFKRAMEGELASTIEAIDGVETAVVHLAMPEKEVFSDQQDPTTASVLVKTRAGSTMSAEQVQVVINLVSSSIDGLKPDKVTVADATGKVLSAPSDSSAASASTQTQQVVEFQDRLAGQVQTMLDRVLGPDNAAVQVTAELGFDKTVTNTTRYFGNPKSLSTATSEENYTSPDGTTDAAGGVVGPDGQMEIPAEGETATDGSAYEKTDSTSDYVINHEVEQREAAPGGVEALHVAVVLDTQALKGVPPADVQELVAAGLGINQRRGDTVEVTAMAFDRTAEAAAAEELEASVAADAKANQMTLIRNGGLIGLGVLVMVIAWLRSRKRAKARDEATNYVVEQLRRDAADRTGAQASIEAPNAALLALETSDADMSREVREEISALVERQPEDVAALLRGWLVERA